MTMSLPPLNPFDPASTASAVFKTLAEAQSAIPDGRTHAILFDANYHQADGPSGWVYFVQKAPKGWNVIADGGYDQPHGLSAGVLLAKSW